MIEEDGNDDSDSYSFDDLRKFNFSYNVEGDEGDEVTTENPPKGHTQIVHTQGHKKKDKATSGRIQGEGQEPPHNSTHEVDEGEEEEARPQTERDEIEILRREIVARDQQIAEMDLEQRLAVENCKEMCEYLERKGLLADLVIDKSRRNGGQTNREDQGKDRRKGRRVEEEEEQGSGSSKVITSRIRERITRGANKSHEEDKLEITKKYIQEIVYQQLQVVGASHLVKSRRRIGRPYLKEFDLIPFPSGYVVPKFRLFDGGKGASPDQHLAHFFISCGNTAVEEAWLLRQFPQSLAGAAFEWYASLEEDNIKSWDEMVDALRSKFAMVTSKITMVDMARERPKKGESNLDYINRWRNMNIRCQYRIPDEEAVALLVQNIEGWMKPYLAVANIHTFEDLITHVARLEQTGINTLAKPEKEKGKGVASTKVVRTQLQYRTNNVQAENGGSNRDDRPRRTLESQINKPYSFKQER